MLLSSGGEGLIAQEIPNGFSDPQLILQNLPEVKRQLIFEQAWHERTPWYTSISGLLGAYAAGVLVKIVPDQNIEPAMRFLNPPLLDYKYPPFLMPYATKIYYKLGELWRDRADAAGLHSSIRLSSASFVRIPPYQKLLVGGGKMVVDVSTHATAFTWDIDYAGYRIKKFYMGRDVVVSKRDPAAQEKVAMVFAQKYGVRDEEPIRLGPEWYDQTVMDCLMEAAGVLHCQGILNAVVENVSDVNRAIHMSVAPPC